MISVMKRIVPISILVMVLIMFGPAISAEQDQVITDPTDDVIFTDATGLTDDEIELTSDRPNVDLTKITYQHPDNSKQVTIIIEVKGVIEDRNDLDTDNFDETDLDGFDFSGSMVSYFLELGTSYSAYQIDYVNGTCNVNEQPVDSTVDGNKLTILFDLETADETFDSIIGYTTEFNIESLMNMNVYMDIAPDDALLIASISAPFTGETGEAISFTGNIEDILGLSSGSYTYTWDWDDGTAKGSGSSPTHTYQFPGEYNVKLTIEDANGGTSEATHTITISQGSGNNNNNGNTGGNSGDSTDDGSGVTMFILVVVIIVIIGIIALVMVIRR